MPQHARRTAIGHARSLPVAMSALARARGVRETVTLSALAGRAITRGQMRGHGSLRGAIAPSRHRGGPGHVRMRRAPAKGPRCALMQMPRSRQASFAMCICACAPGSGVACGSRRALHRGETFRSGRGVHEMLTCSLRLACAVRAGKPPRRGAPQGRVPGGLDGRVSVQLRHAPR